MKRVLIQPDFEAWREAARDALREGYAPEEIDLQDAAVASTLALSFELEAGPTGVATTQPYVSKSFLDDAAMVAVHRNAGRWNLLYRVLYRMQGNRNLLKIETDSDVAEMNRLASQVRRDLHKMHAFVRFRKVMRPGEVMLTEHRPEVLVPASGAADDDGEMRALVLVTPTPFGVAKSEIEQCEPEVPEAQLAADDCEHFVAWYQPDHRILPLAAPFFAERFAIMRWSILTPDASVSWDPVTKELLWSAGVPRESAPDEDELETLWRSYYSSIYNPARLNPRAMRSEMPVRYWKNLPEMTLLPTLVTQSQKRVEGMVAKQQEKTSAAPFVPAEHTVTAIGAALPACEGCELYKHATQAVGGVGPAHAKMMVVGEQPGDQEDIKGLPFVGPAGRLLDQTLEELGIDRSELYVTNAVKHFKFVQKGKLRLHENPRLSEITACKPWLLAEIDAVRPKLIVCLGASAAKSLLGGTFGLMKQHGEVLSTPYAERVMATLHPSAILRARDDASRSQMMEMFKADLAKAALVMAG
ncbi:DNA polymerase [Granulicella aggregans]|uniref:Type-4 uracil-DNA glycosylase n=1 Tax=Granulicella aggregans TaxID=474949 RepID=A0A7W8E3D4_9BACT|nr:UdgX family uracil-DNA binding protein [Granulicella aggregans]MBB5057346.1 DNA polymerase [Granulicella aggregans]